MPAPCPGPRFVRAGAAAVTTARFPTLRAVGRVNLGIAGLGGRGPGHTNS